MRPAYLSHVPYALTSHSFHFLTATHSVPPYGCTLCSATEMEWEVNVRRKDSTRS